MVSKIRAKHPRNRSSIPGNEKNSSHLYISHDVSRAKIAYYGFGTEDIFQNGKSVVA